MLAASSIAISETGLGGEDIDAALGILHHGGGDAILRRKLEALSAQFDDEYFRLREVADQVITPEALLQFRKARAVAALAFALSTEQLHEAIYEAIIASGDQELVVRSIDAALQSS